MHRRRRRRDRRRCLGSTASQDANDDRRVGSGSGVALRTPLTRTPAPRVSLHEVPQPPHRGSRPRSAPGIRGCRALVFVRELVVCVNRSPAWRQHHLVTGGLLAVPRRSPSIDSIVYRSHQAGGDQTNHGCGEDVGRAAAARLAGDAVPCRLGRSGRRDLDGGGLGRPQGVDVVRPVPCVLRPERSHRQLLPCRHAAIDEAVVPALPDVRLHRRGGGRPAAPGGRIGRPGCVLRDDCVVATAPSARCR